MALTGILDSETEPAAAEMAWSSQLNMLSDPAPILSPDRISLKQRVLNAGAWSLLGYAFGQVIRFGSNLLMTRLLVPEMFGVMAIATMVMVCLGMFSDVGLAQSVIQSKRGSDPAFLNTIWVTQIIRGALLWLFASGIGLLLLLADRIGMVPRGSVYADPSLPYVIAILSIALIIGGGQSTKLFEASRNLLISRITRNVIAAQIAGLLCMIGWASIDRSIWALVAGSLCSTFVTAVLSHVWLPGIANRWDWDRSAFLEVIHFGKWIFASSILGFLAFNGDRMLLAGLVNATLLGVYVIAFLFFSSVDQMMTRIITDVSFPALSEIARERRVDLKANYYRFYMAIASFAYCCSGVLMISGHTLIGLLYDPRYEQAGWMLEVLAVALSAIPLRMAASCLLALGLPRLYSHLMAIRVIGLFLLVPLGFHFFDIPGALWAIVMSYFSSLPATIYYMIKHGLFDLRKELLPLPAWIAGMFLAKVFNLLIGH
jgi:O-antigen/teichoic acid export membrane protein